MRRGWMYLIISAVLVLFGVMLAACPGPHSHDNATTNSIKLPKTGQTTSYATGDDGDLQKGAAWPDPRFTDNGDGTITDNLTGLTWLKDANCISTQYPSFDNDGLAAGDGKVTWQHALDFVAVINAGTYSNCGGGHTDWRLPNYKELSSLANYGQATPATWLNTQGFINVKATGYWSSTTCSRLTNSAWGVNMEAGNQWVSGKGGSTYVWPVRDTPSTTTISALPKTGQTKCYDTSGVEISCTGTGQDGDLQKGVAWPSTRFKDNGDGTVTDNLTGLVWLKDANCAKTISYNPDSTGDGSVSWQHALDFIAGINTGSYSNCGGGRTDWRVPTLNELESLVDASQYNPSVPAGNPFINLQAEFYWSSTTMAAASGYAWIVDIDRGDAGAFGKTSPTLSPVFVWPVRGGQ